MVACSKRQVLLTIFTAGLSEIHLGESCGTSFLFIPQGTEIYQVRTDFDGHHAHFPKAFLECLLAEGQH